MDCARLSELLLAALAAGVGVQRVLDTAYVMLGFPMHILDPSFNLLARAGGEGFSDPFWLDFSEHAGISEQLLERIKQSGFLTKVTSRQTAAVDPGVNGGADILSCDVASGGRLLGRFSAWAVGPYGPDELKAVKLIADAIALAMLRDEAQSGARLKRDDYFLSRLVSDPHSSAEEIERDRVRLDIEAEPPLYVAVFTDRRDPAMVARTHRFMESRLNDSFKNVRVSYHDGAVVALFASPNDLGSASGPVAQALSRFAARASSAVGVSRPLRGLAQVREGYRQALAALRFGSGEQTLAFYEDVAVLDFAAMCAREARLEDIVYPPLLDLWEKDRDSRTDCFNTLKVYLDSERNMSKTADVLRIHYNTVKYRLDSIRQSLGIDLEDTANLAKLYFSITILENRDKLI